MRTKTCLASRLAVSVAIAAGALLLAVVDADACVITFGADPVKVDSSGAAKVTVTVKWEHRKCDLGEDEISFAGKGVKVTPQGKWQKVRSGLFTRELSLQLTAKEGSVRAWRECNKKGVFEATVRVSR